MENENICKTVLYHLLYIIISMKCNLFFNSIASFISQKSRTKVKQDFELKSTVCLYNMFESLTYTSHEIF